MKQIITPSITSAFEQNLATARVKPFSVTTHPVRKDAQSVAGTTFQLGCRFHALLRRIRDHAPLNKTEKQLLPWLNTMRDALRSVGVEFIEPEVVLTGFGGLPSGRCDLLLTGGLAEAGVAEVKVVDQLPSRARGADLLQCVGYEELVRNCFSSRWSWSCVVYVSFTERSVRIFAFHKHGAVRSAARELLAA